MAEAVRIVFSPTSLADLQRINEFYTQVGDKVRRSALARITESIAIIARFAEIGRTMHIPGIREFIVPFGKGNFFIRYRTHKNHLQIAHLWHSLEDEA